MLLRACLPNTDPCHQSAAASSLDQNRPGLSTQLLAYDDTSSRQQDAHFSNSSDGGQPPANGGIDARQRERPRTHTHTNRRVACLLERNTTPAPLKPATLVHTDFVGAVREVAPAVECVIPGAGYVADTLREPIDVDISSTAPMFGVHVSTRVSGGAKMMSVWCVSREREGGKRGGAGLTAQSSWAIEQ